MAKANRHAVETEQMVWHAKDDGRIARIFAHREKRKGKHGNLYIVAEISSPSQDAETILHALASSTIEGYHTSHETKEGAFEDAIMRANILLKKMARETTSSWWGSLHVVVALYAKGVLLFSTIGSPLVLLSRTGEVNEISKPQKDGGEITMFENVFTGTLVKDDILLIGTRGLLEIFLTENLKNIISRYEGLPLSKLERLLEERREKIDALFAVLVFRIRGEEDGARDDARKHAVPLLKTAFTYGKALGELGRTLRPLRVPVRVPAVHLATIRHVPIIVIIPIVLIASAVLLRALGDTNNREDFASVIHEIQSDIGDAENALIFKDKTLARKYIEEARLLLANISSKNASGEELTEITKKLKNLEDDLIGTVVIQDPKVAWEITNNLGSPPRYFFISHGKLFAYSDATATMYTKGVTEKLIFLPVLGPAKTTPSVFRASSGLFLSYVPEKGMRTFNPDTETHRTLENVPHVPEEFEVADIASYRDYVYLLGTNGSILKYRLRDTGLVFVEDWLKNAIPASSTPSFAIDGSIYVTGEQNRILKLTNGIVSQTWELPFEAAGGTLISSDELAYVYLLNRSTYSIVKISKNGEVVNVYQSPRFDNLNDMAVDETQNKAYVLNGFTVYEIDL